MELDDAIALVYAQPPSEFVAARSALLKELKGAKRKEAAARVGALRRPTKLAWALGEAVRRAPGAAEAYFTAIAALAEPGRDLRQRTAELRSAVAALVDAAEGAEAGEAAAALLATAAAPDAAAALRLGRLSEVPAAGGFGLAGVVDLPAAVPDRPADGPAPAGAEVPPGVQPPVDGDEAARAAEAERARHEEEERSRTERLSALAREREGAEAAEAAAVAQVAAAQAAVDQAQVELARATDVLDAARKAAAEVDEQQRAVEA